MEPEELSERLSDLRAAARSIGRQWNELHSDHDGDAKRPNRAHSLLADRLDEDLVHSIEEKTSELQRGLEKLLMGAQLLETESDE